MAAVALDAWALLALLRAEQPAAGVVRRYLRRGKAGSVELLVSIVNLGEVYYRVAQISDEARAERALALIRELPISTVPAREAFVMAAARLKARYRLSYADAFAVATARVHGAPVLTGDPEILALPRRVVAVRRLDRARETRG